MAKGIQAALQEALEEDFSSSEEGIEKIDKVSVDQLKAKGRLSMDIPG